MKNVIRVFAFGLLFVSGSALAVDPTLFREVEMGLDTPIIETTIDTGGTDTGGGDRSECLMACGAQRRTCQSAATAEYEACLKAFTGGGRAPAAEEAAYCAEVAGDAASSCQAEYAECTDAC